MQISSNGYTQANEKAIQNSYLQQEDSSKTKDNKKELTVEEQINKSAVEVSLSMNAQIILFAMDAQELSSNNAKAQSNILNFLSGKEVEGQLSLKDIGYEGKPITELSKEEASELVAEDGFFGVDKTSQRVANFVFNFSGDDLDILEKGREGIVKGFEDAQKMWGGELPEISHQTQAKTLELIDARIAELKGEPTTSTKSEDNEVELS
jgi:hypothetical protein